MVNDDLSIFSSDPELTSLRQLSLARLRSGLSHCVPGELLDAPLSTYRISNLRYSPRQKMVVGLTSQQSERPISLRIFPEGKLQNRFDKARQTHPHHAFLIEDLHAVAWVFPGERKLNLDVISEPGRLVSLLQNRRGYRLCGLELMHFVPEHTYTARIHGICANGRRIREYLKIYNDDTGAETACTMQRVARQLGTTEILIPGDVTYIADDRLLIQSEILQDRSRRLSMDSAAFALAKFHNLSIDGIGVQQDNPASEHEAVLRIVGAVFPQLCDEVQSLSDRILLALTSVKGTPHVLLHGDAHLGNMFHTTDRRIGLIDLDRVRVGSGEIDLASFLAFKAWLRMRSNQEPDSVLWQLPQFLHAYNRHARHSIEDRNLTVQLAHKMLTERVRRGISRAKVSSVEDIRSFLRFAAQCMRVIEPDHG